MNPESVLRLIGMIVLAVVGWEAGISLASGTFEAQGRYVILLSLSGSALGFLLTPFVTTRPYRHVRAQLRQLPAQTLVSVVIGLIVGLIIAALMAFPLSFLPKPFSQVLPFVGVVLFGYLGVALMVMRQRDIFNIVGGQLSGRAAGASATNFYVLLDTSVIIDGRIADISKTGFVRSEMLVPRFVLNELQHVADSPDRLRRSRGRRGLEILNTLLKDSNVLVRVTDMDVENTHQVDDKLVLLAKQLRCPIMTNDYNLNRVAELQGVPVMNVNELANAVKAVFLPGESLDIRIIQEGKEHNQGVGYLDDGTMVVIEDGRRHIGQTIKVSVTKVLQTAAGRMIFAKPETWQ
ncbi:MAG: TRAM domain-containing protein [Anaerolineae bacterium]